jgi:hypothetical protein
MNIYKIQHQAICPNDSTLTDVYSITIKTHAIIMVEVILGTLKKSPKTTYHEDLATYLRNELGAEITVEGWHHGVFVTSIRK